MKRMRGEFPSGQVVKIPGFHFCSLGQSLIRKLRFLKLQGTAKTKKKIFEKQNEEQELRGTRLLFGENILKLDSDDSYKF